MKTISVPNRLTSYQIEPRLNIATNRNSRFSTEVENFYQNIVAIDEIWEIEIDRSNQNRRDSQCAASYSRPTKFKQVQS